MLRSLLVGTRGGMSALVAVLFVALLGVCALAVEYGHGLLSESENQRAADLAAVSGAAIYNSTGSSTSMNSAVNAVAALNGVSGAATGSLVASPSGDGNQAVKVIVTTSEPLNFAHVITASTSLSISAVAYAEIGGGEPGCIMALSGSGTGVTLTGGTAISAANCAVTSNNQVSVHCGDTITTQDLDYGTTLSDSCTGIKPPTGKTLKEAHKTTTDPFAGNTTVSAARARLSSVTSMTNPAAPTVPTTGHNVTFGSGAGTTAADVAAGGCTASHSGSTWTVTCSGSGPFNFGTITVSGGVTVNFSTGGSSSAVYNFNGAITNSGTALSFGPGTFNIAQGINISGGGSPTTFGAGAFNIGPVSGSCSSAPSPATNYSICLNGPSLVFGGPSTFVLSGAVFFKGGSTLTMGSSGTSNSFQIGAAGNGDSLDSSGGSKLTMGDATGSGDVFQMVGNFNDGAGGGSCITLSAAANHDINGFFVAAGGVTLGSGVYTVDDYVGVGISGGGDVTCNGATVGVNATDVTFVIGGNATTTCSDGSNQIFCIGAGYAHVTITAPTSATDPLDPNEGFAVIGPASGGAGADFSNGASNTRISGAFYLPTGPVIMSGAATVGDTTSGDCLELIASQISLTGGTATGSSCVTAGSVGGSGTSTAISLVQ